MEKLFWYIDAHGEKWGPFTYEESLEIDDTPNPEGERFGWHELTTDEYNEITRDSFTINEFDDIKKSLDFVKVDA